MPTKYAKSFQSKSIIKSNLLPKVLFLHQTMQSKCSTFLLAFILSLALCSMIFPHQSPPHIYLTPNPLTYFSCVHPFLHKYCHDLWPAWTQLWPTLIICPNLAVLFLHFLFTYYYTYALHVLNLKISFSHYWATGETEYKVDIIEKVISKCEWFDSWGNLKI